MTAYGKYQTTHKPATSFSLDVAQRKAAHRKIVERAQQIERNSYIAFIQKKRRLQHRSDPGTIGK